MQKKATQRMKKKTREKRKIRDQTDGYKTSGLCATMHATKKKEKDIRTSMNVILYEKKLDSEYTIF